MEHQIVKRGKYNNLNLQGEAKFKKLVKYISSNVTPQFYSPEDEILKMSQPNSKLFYVLKGFVNVYCWTLISEKEMK